MSVLELITSFVAVATLIEGFVGAVTKPFIIPKKYNELVKRGLSLVFGLGVAFGFGLDYSAVLGAAPVSPWVGNVFTGAILGIGAGAIHDIFENFTRPTTVKKTEVVVKETSSEEGAPP